MQEDHQFRISHVYLEIHKKVNYNSFILKNHKLYIKNSGLICLWDPWKQDQDLSLVYELALWCPFSVAGYLAHSGSRGQSWSCLNYICQAQLATRARPYTLLKSEQGLEEIEGEAGGGEEGRIVVSLKKIKINKQISFVEFKNSYNLFKDNLAVIENENAHLFIYIQFTIGFLVKHCKAIL